MNTDAAARHLVTEAIERHVNDLHIPHEVALLAKSEGLRLLTAKRSARYRALYEAYGRMGINRSPREEEQLRDPEYLANQYAAGLGHEAFARQLSGPMRTLRCIVFARPAYLGLYIRLVDSELQTTRLLRAKGFRREIGIYCDRLRSSIEAIETSDIDGASIGSQHIETISKEGLERRDTEVGNGKHAAAIEFDRVISTIASAVSKTDVSMRAIQGALEEGRSAWEEFEAAFPGCNVTSALRISPEVDIDLLVELEACEVVIDSLKTLIPASSRELRVRNLKSLLWSDVRETRLEGARLASQFLGIHPHRFEEVRALPGLLPERGKGRGIDMGIEAVN